MRALGRTATTLVWLSLAMLLALLICADKANGDALFTTACLLLGSMATVQGSKSTLEATATGIGLKGAVKAMLGASTPPPEAPKS